MITVACDAWVVNKIGRFAIFCRTLTACQSSAGRESVGCPQAHSVRMRN